MKIRIASLILATSVALRITPASAEVPTGHVADNLQERHLVASGSHRCGPLALASIAAALNAKPEVAVRLSGMAAPLNGCSISQLLAAARSNGVPLVAMQRPSGRREFAVPSIAIEGYNHYVAILQESSNSCLVMDPAAGRSIWMQSSALNEMLSGLFLVPSRQAPSAWRRLSDLESASVRGGQIVVDGDILPDWEDGTPCLDDPDTSCDLPSSNDGTTGDSGIPSPPPCCGMPQWHVSEPYMTVWLEDNPLFYHLSTGRPMRLILTYKHRDQFQDTNACGFGDGWSCNWLGMLQVQSADPNTFTNHMAGGGLSAFVLGALEYRSARTLSFGAAAGGGGGQAGSGSGGGAGQSAPVLQSPTGAQSWYGLSANYADSASSSHTDYFPSQRVDSHGRSVSYYYQVNSDSVLLTNLVDMDGRTNVIRYENPHFPHLITSVKDPYGHVAQFRYDNLGRLAAITDAAQISTTFQYAGTNSVLSSMTTPYGVTSFTYNEETNTTRGIDRTVLVTEASGDQQLYAFCDNSPRSIQACRDGDDSQRISFHWNRKQILAIPATDLANPLEMPSADYNFASIKHWQLQFIDNSGHPEFAISDTLDSQAGPVDPVLGTDCGSMVFSYMDTLQRVTDISINGSDALNIGRNSLGRPERFTFFNDDGSYANYDLVYDASGMYLQYETGPRGELVRGYGYHPLIPNLLTSVTNALNEVVRFTYDTSLMHVTSVAFPGGMLRTNLYYTNGPSRGFLKSQIDIGFRTNSFSYLNGNPVVQTNELGLVTTNTFDGLNRLLGTTFPDHTSISNVYANLDLSGQKDRLGHWTHYGYNAVRQLASETNANGHVTQYDYCGCGALGQIIRWNGAIPLITQFHYDIVGRLTNAVYPDFYQVNRTYDGNNLVTSISDSAGLQTTFDYSRVGLRYVLKDAFDVSSQTGPFLAVFREFDEYGRPTMSVDNNDVETDMDYDFLDRVTTRQVSGAGGSVAQGQEVFVYDSRGLTNYTDPLGQLTTFVRDPSGQALYVTNANLETVGFTYNPSGGVLSLTDGKSQTTSWNYDIYGQVTNKVGADTATMFMYAYDAAGRVTNRWQAGNISTAYAYDPVGNLTNISYPDSGTISYSYDGVERLTNMLDAVGSTSFSWTAGDELASEIGPWPDDTLNIGYTNRFQASLALGQYAASAWVQSYGYDGIGRLNTVSSPAGAFSYQYEQGDLQGYGSAAFDLVSQVQIPTGAVSVRSYDPMGRLSTTSLQTPASAVLDQYGYSYDSGSRRSQQVFTAGNYVNYTYDNIGQLQTANGFEADGVTPRLHEQFGYGYDKAWNLNWKTNNALVLNFQVDTLNQLSSISRTPGSTLTVAGDFEQAAPPVSVTVSGTGLPSGPATVYADGAWARDGALLDDGFNAYVASATDHSGQQFTTNFAAFLPAGIGCQYDVRGNLTTDSIRNFSYDNENQLTSVWVANVWRSDFVYDGLMRRRIRREYAWSGYTWVQTNEIHYIYDGNLVLQERNVNNQRLVTYTRGSDLSGSFDGTGGIGGLLARTDNQQLDSGNPSAHAYYGFDANGNVTCLINTDNHLVAHYSYDPFGNLLALSGPLAEANLYRFSSKECHPNSGLSYYLYRYYDPSCQRWINRDPLEEEGGLNLYTYVFNNSLNLDDPYGLALFGLYDSLGDYLDDVGDTFTGEFKGAGAELTFGLYRPCYTDNLQRQGGYVGTGLAMAAETLGGFSAAGSAEKWAGREFSHAIPKRALPKGLDNLLRATKLNGNYVRITDHALSDAARYKFMPRAWRDANELWNPARRLINRVPRFPLGMGAAVAGGYASRQGDGRCR